MTTEKKYRPRIDRFQKVALGILDRAEKRVDGEEYISRNMTALFNLKRKNLQSFRSPSRWGMEELVVRSNELEKFNKKDQWITNKDPVFQKLAMTRMNYDLDSPTTDKIKSLINDLYERTMDEKTYTHLLNSSFRTIALRASYEINEGMGDQNE